MSIAKATLASPIIRNRQLSIEDIQSLQLPIIIQGDTVTIEKSLIGYKLKQPVIIELNKVLAVKEKGLVNYVITALLNERPKLIPYIFNNESLLKMADTSSDTAQAHIRAAPPTPQTCTNTQHGSATTQT